MLRFSRSPTPRDQPGPQIADGAGARAWLAAMAQPGTVANLLEIAGVLDALGPRGEEQARATLHPQRKYAIVERIRGVLLPVLWDRAREDAFSTLPVAPEFTRSFWSAIDAAVALRDCYAWLVSRLPDVDESAVLATAVRVERDESPTGVRVSRIEALHRALEVNTQLLVVMQRARWIVPLEFWERHCVLGQLVRDLDCQDIEVADPLRLSSAKTCRATFVMPIMIALADPASRSATEFDVVRMASQRWSNKMGFRIEAKGDASSPPARPVASPGPSVTLGGWVLRFDTQSTMKSIDKRLAALDEGKSPREVGIGDALRPHAARELLRSLRVRWGPVSPTDIATPDRAWRDATPGAQFRVALSLTRTGAARGDEVAAIDGVTRGSQAYAYQRRSYGEIAKARTFVEGERVEQLLAGGETWTLLAEAPDAFRCLRRHAKPRIGLQRLVALQATRDDMPAPFLLGWIEALNSTLRDADDGERLHTDAHEVRVRLAQGLPVIVKASADEEELDYAFVLVPPNSDELPQVEPVPAGSFFPMRSDTTVESKRIEREHGDSWARTRAHPDEYALVLPHSTYRQHRLLRVVRDGSLAMLRLEQLLLRGADFDLARFVPL